MFRFTVRDRDCSINSCLKVMCIREQGRVEGEGEEMVGVMGEEMVGAMGGEMVGVMGWSGVEGHQGPLEGS